MAPARPFQDLLTDSPCVACGHHVAVPIYDGGSQPLATLGWPQSKEGAQAMPRLRLLFVRCLDCGHVYNAAFDYADVPYANERNRMFNRGALWSEHLRAVMLDLLDCLPENPTVVEIGCGDGMLLRALAMERPAGRFFGFDPNGAIDAAGSRIQPRPRLFDPVNDVSALRPDLIICRHVLEHLPNPLVFVSDLSSAARAAGIQTRLFVEVPCIERALATGRTTDLYYEHNSHFTTMSLQSMLERSGNRIEWLKRSYGDEIVRSLSHLAGRATSSQIEQECLAFRSSVVESQGRLTRALALQLDMGKTVAIWGGTGKGAAFICRFNLDADRFPIVVDSDDDKVGTFVPGTGQEIRPAGYLLRNPTDLILIATQWRARDIVLEIERMGITYDQILLEHGGELVPFTGGAHPYG